jgi:hypothetical protein
MKQITGAGWLKDINDNFAAVDPQPATTYFVDTVNGSNNNNGQSFGSAFATMAKALSVAETGSTIYFTGDVREQLTGSNTLYDISIVGVGSLHHPDKLVAEHPGACMWRMPASGGVETTPLLIVRGRGWKFINIAFDGPATAAAVQLVRTAEGASEYDASHASFIGCRFYAGQNHIENNGGVAYITIRDCHFQAATGASLVKVAGAAIAFSLCWKILNNYFAGGPVPNASHIVLDLDGAVVADNFFGVVTSTGLYIDLRGGQTGYNLVSRNVCAGEWDTSNYKGATGDFWGGNNTAVDASTSAVGFSIAVPD